MNYIIPTASCTLHLKYLMLMMEAEPSPHQYSDGVKIYKNREMLC